MWWMIICIFVVGVFCFFIGFGIRRSNNNRQNVRDKVLINDSNNRQNESDVLKDLSISHNCSYQINNADINKDLSISHSSYQINSKVLKKKSNSFGGNDIDKRMTVLRIPGKFRQRLEKLEKKQQISRRYRKIKYKVKNMFAPKPMDVDVKEERYRKIKYKVKNMFAPKPMDVDVKEDEI